MLKINGTKDKAKIKKDEGREKYNRLREVRDHIETKENTVNNKLKYASFKIELCRIKNIVKKTKDWNANNNKKGLKRFKFMEEGKMIKVTTFQMERMRDSC